MKDAKRRSMGKGIRKRLTRRAAAVVLTVCMAFTMMPALTFAETADQKGKTDRCEYHTEHTAACGYQEGQPGHPCGHRHGAECYTKEQICDLIEDEDAGPTATGSNVGHRHTEDCYELVVDCPHERGEHTEDCGYTEGEAGTPCGHICEMCGKPDEDNNKEIAALCAAIDDLPTVDELYENAPGNADPEFDDWVSETRAKLAQVPALWEKLSALLEDAAARGRITEERVNKVEALNDLAARLKEMETQENVTAPTVESGSIYANGQPIKIVAGSSSMTAGGTVYTKILYGEEFNTSLSIDGIQDGDYTTGYDLSQWTIYGGGKGNTTITADPNITMTGGKVKQIRGGGSYGSTVNGDITVTVEDGEVRSLTGGGYNSPVTGNITVTVSGGKITAELQGGDAQGASVSGDISVTVTGGEMRVISAGNLSGTVGGSVSLAVGGSAKIGNSTESLGIIINGKSRSGVQTTEGVDQFAISESLSETVYICLPDAYDVPDGSIIATDAAVGDFDKLIFTGNTTYTAYFDGTDNTIKMKAAPAPGGMIWQSVSSTKIEDFFGQRVTVTDHNVITLTGDVTLAAAVEFESGDWILDLAGHTLAGAAGLNEEGKEDGITPVTLTGGSLKVISTSAGGSLKGGDGNETYAGSDTHQGGQGGYGLSLTDESNGVLYLTDSRVTLQGGDGRTAFSDGGCGLHAGGGTVTLTGVTCQGGNAGRGTGGSGGDGILLRKEVTVSGGITCSAKGGDPGDGNLVGDGLYCQTAATITGGTYTGVCGASLNLTEEKTVTVTGGEFTGKAALSVLEASGKVVLQGGSFAASGDGSVAVQAVGDKKAAGLLNTGYGYYIGDVLQTVEEYATTVGAAGQTVTVKQKPDEAVQVQVLGSDNTVKGTYADLQAAIDAAADGDTLKLLTDIALGSPGYAMCGALIDGNRSLTLNLGDKNITYRGAGSNAAVLLRDSASLRVEGTTGSLSAIGDGVIAITNGGTGSVSVEGGTVSAEGAAAISNSATGKIKIGGTARVTSGASGVYSGTIYLNKIPTEGPKTVLEITDGTVENTAGGYVIYFYDRNVTSENVTDCYKVTGGTVTGKIHPEQPAYTATVTLNRDGSVWTDHGKTVKLKAVAGAAEYANGASVPDGTYRILVDGVDTEKILTVNGMAASAQISYYTVTFYDGTAAYGIGTAQQPQIVLSGGKAVKPEPDPVKDGYTFARWVSAAGGTAAYDFENTEVTQRTAVYAGWTSVGNGGSNSTTGTTSKTPSTNTITAAVEGGSITTTTTTATDSSGKTTTVTTQVTRDTAGNVTGSATTLTTDNIQTASGEGVIHVTVRPDASAINSAATSVGATAEDPLKVQIQVPHETTVSELAKPEIRSVAVDVMIPTAAANNPNVELGVTVAKATVQAAKDAGKNVAVTIRNEYGQVEAVWSFDGEAMRNTNSEVTDVSLSLHTAPVLSEDPLAQPVKPLAAARGNENGLVLNISGAGRLTAPAKLTVPATNQTGIKAGDQVALYRHDPASGTLVPVPGGSYTVDANGNVTMDLPAKDFAAGPDRYVLLPVPAAGTVPPDIPAIAGATTPYEIKRGDTLNKIAREYGCTVQDLLNLNHIPDVEDLRIGQVIQLPVR